MDKTIYGQAFRFACTGVVNTLAGMAVMFGLYNIFGCSYWVSSAVNYTAVSVLSYFLNRKITFGYSGKVLKSGIRFAVNIAVCYLVAYGAAKPLVMAVMADSPVRLRENAAMLAGMCIFTGLNFLGQRFFVFGEKKNMDYRKIYEKWAESPHLEESEKNVLAEMSEEEMSDAFYRKLSFGTAGMRGVMGLGTNRLNKYTIRMAAKGFAGILGEGARVAIAYDTRNHSDEFAKEAARVLAASGVKALLFDRYSPVPLLSFTVRDLKCDGGIVITASHNLPAYNGFKVYDRTGCQLGRESAAKISENIENLDDELGIPVSDEDDPNIEYIGQDVIDRFMDAVQKCGVDTAPEAASDLSVVYTPLHGSGREYVLETLRRAGFSNVTLVKEQADYNGDFPTVRKPNPEETAVFYIAEEKAKEIGADVIIGTDPDSDRIGAGVMHDGKIVYLSGNQTGALFVDFLARMRQSAGKKLITSIVTGDMGQDIAASYGVETIRTFTGFKDLAAEMNRHREDEILMAYEESYGYLTGTHIRDKDGISSSLVMCQMAAYWKQQGKTLIDVLEDLFAEHGYYIDDQLSFVFEGAAGADRIASIMKRFRSEGESVFADICELAELRDYSRGAEGVAEANVLKFMFSNGSWAAARPSGTEPKVKFYCCIKDRDREQAEKLHSLLKNRIEKEVEQA